MERKDIVLKAWNNAYFGGYKDFLDNTTPENIAVDMMDKSESVEAAFRDKFEQLVEIITEIKYD